MGSLGLRPIRTNSRYQSFGALQGDLDSKRADLARLKDSDNARAVYSQRTGLAAAWPGRGQAHDQVTKQTDVRFNQSSQHPGLCTGLWLYVWSAGISTHKGRCTL